MINIYLQVNIRVGLYGVFLHDWFDTFGQDKINIVLLEDYSKNKTAALIKLFKFLDLGKRQIYR